MSFIYRIYYIVIGFFIILLFRIKANGRENLFQGPAIIASNHCSYLDPFFIALFFPKEELHFLAKAYPFRNPIIRFFKIKNIHVIDPDRHILDEIEEIIKKGYKVIIFPEGTRSKTGSIQPFKRGIGALFLKTNVPIIPVYLEGSYNAWPKGKLFPKLFTSITCHFGQPLYQNHNSSLTNDRKTQQQICEQVQQVIVNLKQQSKSF